MLTFGKFSVFSLTTLMLVNSVALKTQFTSNWTQSQSNKLININININIFISEQKLKYSTIVYIKLTCQNRIYNKFNNN